MGRCLFLLASALLLPGALSAATVSSGALQINADAASFRFGLSSSATYPIPLANLCIGCSASYGLNQIVVNVDNVPADILSGTVVSPLTSSGSGLGASIDGTKSFGGVQLAVHYEIADNPATGTGADTLKAVYTFSNPTAAPHQVGLRVMMEVSAQFNDGVNTADNFLGPMTAVNTVWRSGTTTLPQNFWVHNMPTAPATSTFVGQGHLYNNAFGEPATLPDVFEIAQWGSVSGNTQWTIAPAGSINDSGTAHWYTGSGSENGLRSLAPGASWRIVLYYGISQQSVQVTPPPTRTPTPTRTMSRTITPSPTISATWTTSPTPTVSATVSATWTSSPTPTISATASVSPTPVDQKDLIELRGIYPMPFSEKAHVFFTLLRDAKVTMTVYNVAGEIIAIKSMAALQGPNVLDWDGTNDSGARVASGAYIGRLKAESGGWQDDLWLRMAVLR